MHKNLMVASSLALFLSVSLISSAEASKPKKPPKNQQQQDQSGLQSEQGQYDRNSNSGSAGNYSGGSGNSNYGSNSNGGGNSSGGSDSVSMFKAGNTSLPAGTYAMTNVNSGAAFVVIVDDSGDMRAQDARAMNLIGDGNKNSGGGGGGNRKKGSSYDAANYDGDSNGGGGNYGGGSYGGSSSSYSGGSSGYSGSSYGSSNNHSGSSSPPQLTPEPTPASAVLPTPMKGHPLLQGASTGSVYPSGGGNSVPNLYTQQNPLLQGQANGQFPGGLKGALQQELQRQLGKQIMKHGPAIQQEVRKVIDKFN